VTATLRTRLQRLLSFRSSSRETESGQSIVVVIFSVFALLGLTGLVVDLGYAYYAERSLQASTDAAALAGAAELPNLSTAVATADSYSGRRGAKNNTANLPPVTATVTTKCLASAPGCSPSNAVVVDQKITVKTSFMKLFGVGELNLHRRSTACSPCTSKPLDIVIVLDRTGSMCQDHWGGSDPSCADLNSAREGIRTFLSYFDSRIQWVGLAVFPPAPSLSQRCNTPVTTSYNSTGSPYVIVPLSKDYKTGGSLNPSSDLITTLNCQKGGGRTAYANAIEKAQAELDTHGRSNAQDLIVFFSDGAANIGPTYYSTSSPYRKQPCHQGMSSAAGVKSKGTILYSIGYDLNAENGGANKCTTWDDKPESPTITAYQAIQQIATEPGAFFDKPGPGELNSIFNRVAADISSGSSRLVDNNTP